MNSKDYWSQRATERMDSYMDDAEATARELSKAYHKASLYLDDEARSIIKSFQGAFDLSETEARLLLRNADGKDITKLLSKTVESISDADKKRLAQAQISSPAYAHRISRLVKLSDSIEKTCSELAKGEIKKDRQFLTDEVQTAFLHSIYDYDAHTSFDMIPQEKVKEILRSAWSGRNYSSRIWQNTENLAQSLKTEILVGILSGKSEQKLSERMTERFAVGSFEAKRLIRTETCYVTNRAELESYEALELEQYEYLACIDGRTSDVCRKLNGKRFKVKDARVGVNLPPMHPFCRSTTIAVTKNSDELDRRIAELTDSTGADVYFYTWRNSLQKLPNGKYQYVKAIDISNGSGIIRISMQHFAKKSTDCPTIILPKDEYAHVMSEIATHISEEQKNMKVFLKAIGNYNYTVENNGFGDYRIIGKRLLDGE